jgi:hypothetical protein
MSQSASKDYHDFVCSEIHVLRCETLWFIVIALSRCQNPSRTRFSSPSDCKRSHSALVEVDLAARK